MTFQEKRHTKKLARLFFTIGYAFMVTLVVIFIGAIFIMFTTKEGTEPLISGTLLLSLGCFSIAFCIAGGAIGQHFLNKRIYYKEAIEEYRQCSFFTQAIRLVMVERKEFMTQAIDLYDLIDEDTPRRRFLFGFIIASNYFSKDKERVTKGKKRLEEILNTYDPEKVKFKK